MDCCKAPERKNAARAEADRCPQCGAKGRRVSRETMESLLASEARSRLEDTRYYFDRTPECRVVYFSNEPGSYFTKDELTVRVGIKETAPPIPMCYCFGHTAESAREEIARTGRTTIPEKIQAEIRAGNCRCEVKNPSGSCCLGEVNRVIRAILKELEEEPAARA